MICALCGKNAELQQSHIIPKRFCNYVYPLSDLISDEAINKISTGCLFGYVMYFKDSNSFSVIVYYAGLVFVTDYLYDRTKFIILNAKPILFRERCNIGNNAILPMTASIVESIL